MAWNVSVEQESEAVTTISSKSTTVKLNWAMELLWTVQSVDEQGSAAIVQRCKRLHMTVEMPKAGTIAYDSAVTVSRREMSSSLPTPCNLGSPRRAALPSRRTANSQRLTLVNPSCQRATVRHSAARCRIFLARRNCLRLFHSVIGAAARRRSGRR